MERSVGNCSVVLDVTQKALKAQKEKERSINLSFLLILSNLVKIIKNRKCLPRSRDRVAPGVVEGEGGAAVVREEVA